jgi:hypothetical protein
LAAARLRAAIWQSVFTHDMRRYQRALYRYMGDITTLITGPSGTGKELVAQSIAYSRFVEFDSKARRFATNYADSLVSLNLTAIAPTLIESELFGHAKGAFTDAKTERQGYLDEAKCPRWGTVLLDEIGDLDAQIQVKLLRVLQNREFQRVGDSTTRKFVGKIVAATNRDLAAEMEAGRFREDFYYRLVCRPHRNAFASSSAPGVPRGHREFRAVHCHATTSRTSGGSRSAHGRGRLLGARKTSAMIIPGLETSRTRAMREEHHDPGQLYVPTGRQSSTETSTRVAKFLKNVEARRSQSRGTAHWLTSRSCILSLEAIERPVGFSGLIGEPSKK